MSTDPLDEVQRSASAGDVEGARNGLVRVLRADPQNIAAWELLATLVDDPDKRASCYRQILRIDPGNSQIAARLAALANQAPAASAEETSSIGKPRTLRCQQCGGAMEVRFAGELRDKRAVCGFCGSEIDLPDAFQRVETQHDHQHRPWGSHTVDTLLVETRIDYGADRQPAQDTPDIDEIRQLLREKGPDALNADTVQRLEEAGFTVSASLTAGVRFRR
jgi:hypothetical protein